VRLVRVPAVSGLTDEVQLAPVRGPHAKTSLLRGEPANGTQDLDRQAPRAETAWPSPAVDLDVYGVPGGFLFDVGPPRLPREIPRARGEGAPGSGETSAPPQEQHQRVAVLELVGREALPSAADDDEARPTEHGVGLELVQA